MSTSPSLTDIVSEFRVNSETYSAQYDASVAALSGGGYVVTWTSYGQDGQYHGVYAQRYDSDGVAQGGEFRVNTETGDSQEDAAVSALADGGFVIAWASYGQDSGGTGIFAQRYDSDGAAVGAEFQVNTEGFGSQYNPSIVGLEGGGFVVTWTSTDQDGSGTGVYGQMYASNGSALNGEFQINTETISEQYASDVTALVGGGFVVTWTSRGQDGSYEGVFAQRYDNTGATAGSEFRINTTTESFQEISSVAPLADGGFVVAWESWSQDGAGDGIVAQRFDSSGTAVGSEFLVNTTISGSQRFPHVVSLDDGGFVVVWTDESGADGSSYGIFSQRFASDGTPVGGEEQVNSYTSDEQNYPGVAQLADGSLAFTWTSSYQDGSSSGVYSKIADHTVAPTGDVSISGTAAEDQTLTASNTLADEDGLGVITYQWQRDGVAISGATGDNYTLTQDDVGAAITVTANYTDGGGFNHSVASADTSAVTNVNDDPTGSVTISGTVAEDQTLTASHTLADEDGLGTVTYQWQRGGVDIAGATGSSYTLTQDDVGAVITVTASYTDDEGTAESVVSTATAAVANVNDDPTGSVTISGTVAEDQTLTASHTLADEDGLGTVTYQWQRGGVDIAGATGSSYTLTQDDVGTAITVVASYTDDEGTAESVVSTATAAVTNVNDDPTGNVRISGTVAEDQTLTASHTLGDEDGLGTVSYQWQRGGVDIAGATGSSYTLTQDDVGAAITVVASYTDDEGTAESVVSTATAAVANVNDDPTGSVTISGTAVEEQTLTASHTLGDEDGLGTVTYQWQRGGVDIAGATGSSYTLTQDDVGAAITVVASYTDDEGTAESVVSTATAAVANVNDDPTGSVTISGTAAEDQTLTASHTLGDEDGLGTVTYQWQRGGVDIAGATGSSYTLTQDDVGAAITVVASYTDDEGTAESVVSTATAAVANVNDDPTGSVTISGTVAEDQTLTASHTLGDEDGLGTVSYQWQRGGVDIAGATGSSYTLTQDDVGAAITVVASYTDDEGTAESVVSTATAAVANVNDDPTGSVTISGTAAEDQTLTASHTLGDEDGLGTVSYQWQRGGVDIAGATGSSYTLTQDDVGAAITVVASYTDDEGTAESVVSTATAAVANVNDDPTGSVTISGTAAEDQTLTASHTLGDEDGLGTVTYQWQRGGVDIAGATGSSYTLTQDDVGAAITVVASYTDDEGTAESVVSTATAAVANVNDDPTGSVTISGNAKHGHTLTATHTLSDEDGLGTVVYQWQRDGVDIAGATGDTFTLTLDDVDAEITVVASFVDGEDTAEHVYSVATSSVRYGDFHQIDTTNSDEMRGRYGDDFLAGRDGDDRIVGGWGRDTLKGNTGSDDLHGGRGDDLLSGGRESDNLFGGKGNDTLKGGHGADRLFGRRDDDEISGGRGRDTLKGGEGDDLLTGGFGEDTFVFGRSDGNDTITDFGRGNDLIEITLGARSLEEITFSQSGDDVLLTFASTTVLVENATTAELNDADNFLFT